MHLDTVGGAGKGLGDSVEGIGKGVSGVPVVGNVAGGVTKGAGDAVSGITGGLGDGVGKLGKGDVVGGEQDPFSLTFQSQAC